MFVNANSAGFVRHKTAVVLMYAPDLLRKLVSESADSQIKKNIKLGLETLDKLFHLVAVSAIRNKLATSKTAVCPPRIQQRLSKQESFDHRLMPLVCILLPC